MVYSSPGYCGCGDEVWIEYLWDGKEWKNRFFGSDHREVTFCPNCGRGLNEEELESM